MAAAAVPEDVTRPGHDGIAPRERCAAVGRPRHLERVGGASYRLVGRLAAGRLQRLGGEAGEKVPKERDPVRSGAPSPPHFGYIRLAPTNRADRHCHCTRPPIDQQPASAQARLC